MESIKVQSSIGIRSAVPVQRAANVKPYNADIEEKAAKQEPEKDKSNDAVKSISTSDLVKEVNQHVENFSTKIEFSYDAAKNKSTIIVIDKESGDVIRQIPAEEMVGLVEKMEEISGIIFNRRA